VQASLGNKDNLQGSLNSNDEALTHMIPGMEDYGFDEAMAADPY